MSTVTNVLYDLCNVFSPIPESNARGVALGPPYSCVDWSCSFLTHSHSQCRVAPEYSLKRSSAHPRGDFAIRTLLVVLLSFPEEFKHCLDNDISQEDKILCGDKQDAQAKVCEIVSAGLRGRKAVSG